MHSRTIATLDRLEKASWFSRVGFNEGSGAAVVTAWPEAIEQCDSSGRTCRERHLNQYRECIARRSKDRLQLWNDMVDEVQKITRPLVGRKIAAVVREHALPKIFNIPVDYDITNACMEAEYANVCPPRFFTSIGYWYVNGHFPCGWWELFPRESL
jgi:hypothetical protein